MQTSRRRMCLRMRRLRHLAPAQDWADGLHKRLRRGAQLKLADGERQSRSL